MYLEEALVLELNGIAAFNGRIYPLFDPEANALSGTPYLIYVSTEGVRNKTLDGYQDDKQVPVELNIISHSYSTLKELIRLVIDLIIDMEQRVIGLTGPFVKEVQYEEPREIHETDAKLYRCNLLIRFYI